MKRRPERQECHKEREREGEGGRGREGEGEIQRRNKSHGGFDADTLDIPTLLKMEFDGGESY